MIFDLIPPSEVKGLGVKREDDSGRRVSVAFLTHSVTYVLPVPPVSPPGHPRGAHEFGGGVDLHSGVTKYKRADHLLFTIEHQQNVIHK